MLTGVFLDGAPVGGGSPEGRVRRSVAGHLRALLGSRRLAMIHLPEHGMPDFGDVFRRLPGSAQEVRSAVEELIRRCEPRLEGVRVEFDGFDPVLSRMRFRISGSLVGGGRVRFESEFSSSGRGDVREAASP